MIRKGIVLKLVNITEPDALKAGEHLWEIIEVIGDAVCIQSFDERADKFGNAHPVFWMRKKDLVGNPGIEVALEEDYASLKL